MGDTSIQYVADAICRASASRFLTLVDRYLKGTGGAEPAFSFFRFRKAPADPCDGIEKECRDMAATLRRCTDELMNFRFSRNGRRGAEDMEDRTRRCFSRLRRQQMGLMAEIAGEIRIIGDLIRQAEQMRRLTRTHFPTLFHTSCLMDVIRERINQRPTTLLRLQGRDRGIAEINQTFSEVNASENAWKAALGPNGEDGPGAAADPIRRVNAELCAEIRRRGRKIRSAEKELKQGTKLLLGLAMNGYSDRMHGRLTELAARYDARTGDFLRQVAEARKSRPRA